MSKKNLKNQIYVGVVEDNNDPERLGRLKVRVFNIFDKIPVENIPWATPWKDLTGSVYSLPEVGKVVGVVFDNGNIYKPEFINSEHYNVNLENKLKKLQESDYLSMGSIFFDHKTQIYVNESEGLKIDHKFNNINIKEGTININLKDNNADLNLGDETAGQQAILGNHFLDWFDKFVDNLLGTNAGPYLGNLGAPVIANPAMIQICLEYKAKRNPLFLSHHVNIVDNNKISTVRNFDRENKGQVGDTWKSTVTPNETTKSDPAAAYAPKEGPKKEYDEGYIAPPIDGSGDQTPAGGTNTTGNQQESGVPPGSGATNQSGQRNPPPKPLPLSNPKSQPKIDKLIRFMKSKNYTVYNTPHILNMVALRKHDDGVITNKFDETLCVFFVNGNNNWELYEYQITTVPGFLPGQTVLPDVVAVMSPGQWEDVYKIKIHGNGKSAHEALGYSKTGYFYNKDNTKYDFTSKKERGAIGLNIHCSDLTSSSLNVNNYSEGAQVFGRAAQYFQFMSFCKKQVNEGKKSTFTYTLSNLSDFDNFT